MATDLVPTCLSQLSHGIYSMSTTQNLRWLLVGTADGQIRKYDVYSSLNGKQKLTQAQMQGLPETLTKAAIPIGQWDNDETLFEVHSTGKEDHDADHDIDEDDVNEIIKYWTKTRLSPVLSLAVHSEALWALSGCKTGAVCLWSVRHDQGTCLHRFSGHHKQPVGVLKVLASEQSFISGAWDSSLKLFDLNGGECVRDFAAGHKSQIMSVDVHPTDSQLFLSSSFDGLVLAWDIRQPDAVARFESSASCMHACWNYNGTRVFCARRNESIDEWSSDGNVTGNVMKLPPNSGPVSNLLRIGESTLLSSSMDNLRIWDLSDNTTSSYPFTLLPGHTGGFISSMIYQNGFLMTASGNKGLQGYQESNQLTIYEPDQSHSQVHR